MKTKPSKVGDKKSVIFSPVKQLHIRDAICDIKGADTLSRSIETIARRDTRIA